MRTPAKKSDETFAATSADRCDPLRRSSVFAKLHGAVQPLAEFGHGRPTETRKAPASGQPHS